MPAPIVLKDDNNAIKNESSIILTTFCPLYVCMGIKKQYSRALFPIWPDFELVLPN